MAITLKKITPTQHQSATVWIEEAFDITWTGDASHTWKAVQRHYDGGWKGFLTDLGDDTWH